MIVFPTSAFSEAVRIRPYRRRLTTFSPRTRTALKAAQAVTTGRMTADEASAQYDLDDGLLGIWLRALAAAGLAQSVARLRS